MEENKDKIPEETLAKLEEILKNNKVVLVLEMLKRRIEKGELLSKILPGDPEFQFVQENIDLVKEQEEIFIAKMISSGELYDITIKGKGINNSEILQIAGKILKEKGLEKYNVEYQNEIEELRSLNNTQEKDGEGK